MAKSGKTPHPYLKELYVSKVALIVIYNHQHNENIEIIERIYSQRFSNIYHLVPFYQGDKSNVIPVYENSHYFQGYVAQGYKTFFREEYVHYFFIADDLLLNPMVNENNYTEHLKLNATACFLPVLRLLHKRTPKWCHTVKAVLYNINTPGVEATNQLPNYDVALQAFKKFGLDIKPLSFSQIWKTWRTPSSMKDFALMLVKDTFNTLRYIKRYRKQYNLSYPLVSGYSDIFVVSSDAISQFCHYCGVFATAKLFVEIGLPTALVLSAQEIVTEKDLKLQGKALWTKEDYSILDKYESSFKKLLDDFPAGHLYIHPIKLSKWRTKL